MRLVRATFVNNEVEPGWEILDAPIGKHYLVDLDRVEQATMTRMDTGKQVVLDCIFVVSPDGEGWLPMMALKIEGDA